MPARRPTIRTLARAALPVLVAGALALGATGAAADTPATVTIVGPVDAVDSGLFAKVIEPQFKGAFPQFELSYDPAAQNAAMNDAENGTGGPSVLLLHEPKLESEFVAAGFSAENQLGDALFYDDYVLAGTAGDGAGVATAGGSHDIARAFAAVAAAGLAGTATFDSRGGTNFAPAATIEEHAIWKLVSEAGLTPAGVSLCDVTAADGGGMTPITQAALAGDPQAPFCPSADGGIATNGDLPVWYRVLGGNQSQLLGTTDACTGTTNGSTNCYALTDRGTYDYMATGIDPAGTIANLQVASAGQGATAPGGPFALLARFDGYVIDPAKPGETVNLQGARDLIGFLTSPAEQAQIAGYLRTVPKSPGAPFTPDAAPAITAVPSTTSVSAGRPVTVSGSVADPEPGYPGFPGQSVIVRAAGGTQVASGLLDSSDRFSVSFVPPASGSYEVATAPISRLVQPTAVPPFGDRLTPAASAPFALTVTAAPAAPRGPKKAGEHLRIGKVEVKQGTVTLFGVLGSPSPGRATVSMLVKRLTPLRHRRKAAKRATDSKAKTKKPALKKVASKAVAAKAIKFSISQKLPRGFHYAVELSYKGSGGTVTSAAKHVAVP